jgi:phospholipid/cholesterol/gamma-HCH transport system ATP-binding protein
MKEPLIQVRNLVTRFGDKTILDHINLDIYPNEVTIVLGASGCGKTTLLKSITGLVKPAEGDIFVFGKPFTESDEKGYKESLKRMGVLFQNGALLNSLSVKDNVSIPLEQHSHLDKKMIEKSVAVKLSLVGLSHALHLLPSELSGGMRKRAALARAIALDPEILFCDEPSAGLDPLSSAALDKLILTLKKQFNMTILIVTHELASIHRIADRIVFLDEGNILFTGPLNEAKTCGIEAVEIFFKTGDF